MIKNEKNNIFWAFSEKYGKMLKKGRNDEKGSYIDEKWQNGQKMKKNIFCIFFQKNMEKCRKKVKNGEKGWYIDKKWK